VLRARRLLLVLVGTILIRLLTLPFYPILDRTEARYAYIGELMVQTGNWITPFIDHGVPYWAKPILAFWLTAASYTLFGVNAFAARLPNFLIYAATLGLVFVLGRDQHDRKFGLAATCIFASTSLAFYLGGTVMTDPALMLGVTLVMTGFWKSVAQPTDNTGLWGYLFFIGAAVGVLAKGPIGVVLPGISIMVWATMHREWPEVWRRLPWLTGTVLTLLLVVPWYVLAEIRTPGFLRYFIIGEHFERFLVPHWTGDLYGGGRPRPWGTIWLFGVIASLPWSVAWPLLLIRPRARQELFNKKVLRDRWLTYLALWILAPLVLFTFAANILITYVAPGLAAFALLTVEAFRRSGEEPDRNGFAATAGMVPVLFLAAVIAVLIDPGSRYVRTQAGIIATYKRLTKERPADIVYVVNKPYSADYYTAGNAKYVHGSSGMVSSLAKGNPYFVVPDDVYPRLPDQLRQRLEVVVARNRNVLLRPKSAP